MPADAEHGADAGRHTSWTFPASALAAAESNCPFEQKLIWTRVGQEHGGAKNAADEAKT